MPMFDVEVVKRMPIRNPTAKVVTFQSFILQFCITAAIYAVTIKTPGCKILAVL